MLKKNAPNTAAIHRGMKDLHEAAEMVIAAASEVGTCLREAQKSMSSNEYRRYLREDAKVGRAMAQRLIDLRFHIVKSSTSNDPVLLLRHINAPLSKQSAEEEWTDLDLQASEMFQRGGGITAREISEKLDMPLSRVKKVYYKHAVPAMLKMDWVDHVRNSRPKAMGLSEVDHIAKAHLHANPDFTHWEPFVQSFFPDITKVDHGRCNLVLRNGNPAVIDAVKRGAVLPSRAEIIIRDHMDDHAKQNQELQKFVKKHRETPVNDLRSRVSHMADEKIRWEQEHGTSEAVFRDIAEQGETQDIREIIHLLKSVSQWADTVAKSLEKT
jgi:hypothetical protein